MRPERVAAAIIAALAEDRPRTFVPRWLALPAALRAVCRGPTRPGAPVQLTLTVHQACLPNAHRLCRWGTGGPVLRDRREADRPNHEITVFERDAEGSTYGWA